MSLIASHQRSTLKLRHSMNSAKFPEARASAIRPSPTSANDLCAVLWRRLYSAIVPYFASMRRRYSARFSGWASNSSLLVMPFIPGSSQSASWWSPNLARFAVIARMRSGAELRHSDALKFGWRTRFFDLLPPPCIGHAPSQQPPGEIPHARYCS